jgi:hypothetical protein
MGSPGTINVNEGGTTNVDIEGLDDIQLTLNVPDPITTNSNSTSNASLAITEPINLNTSSTMAITEPIVMETTSSMTLDVKPLKMDLDVKPLVMDLCVTFKLADLPNQQVRRPYERFYGLTLFGREVIGLRMSGETQIIIEDLPRRPSMVWGPVGGGSREGRFSADDSPEGPHALRIRLKS